MKLSAKLREETGQNPLIRAKIPVTVLGVPFISGIVAGDSSDVSFSLCTNFSSGPSLSVSYHPPVTSSPVSGTTDSANYNKFFPFSVSLKSGISLHGSPHNSPLVFTARFNLSRSINNSVSNPTLTPSFSLLIKPQFGNFSLRKSTSSGDGSQSRSEPTNSQNWAGVGNPIQWKELKNGVNLNNRVDSNGILSGIYVTAKTVLPVSKRAMVNCRWGVNFAPESIGQGLKVSRPVLVLNKIGIERVNEAKESKEPDDEKKKRDSGDTADVELLKGVCGLMGKEMRELERQNREIMQVFEEMRTPGSSWRNRRGNSGEFKGLRGVQQSSSSGGGGGGGEWSSDFEKWRRRSKKNGAEEAEKTDCSEKSVEKMSEMESELKKAIQASNGS